MRGDLAGGRIATPDYVYVFERPASGWLAEGRSATDVHAAFQKRFYEELTKTYAAEAVNAATLSDDIWKRRLEEAEHAAYEIVAKEFGWGYRRYRR